MKKYIFPRNFDYLTKLFGLIEYKLLIPLAIFAVILILILSLVNISIITKIGIFVSIFLPVFLLFNTNVNHEPFYIFIFCLIKHYQNASKYLLK